MSPEIIGYSFPNDIHVTWSLMIAMYPYLTGLVAGAFMVSALYHVFGITALKPVSRLSLVTSFGFLLFATVPLLVHLGHPERSLNIVFTPNFSSAMAGFGFIYTAYFILVLFEIWLIYRKDIILLARRSRGIKRAFYACLALGVYDISEPALAVDHKTVTILAAIGIPLACFLHGYVGFIFGAIKANAWWSTPLMPIVFLFSAIVSGIALLILLYLVLMKFANKPIEPECVQALCQWEWLFIIVTVTLELLEIITLAYERSEAWMVIAPLLSNQLAFSFIGIQIVFGSLIPIILLGIVVLLRSLLTNPLRNTIAFIAALLLMMQVFTMRWNIVIGGQIFSKSMRGFRENYSPGLFEKEGILVALLIFLLPFVAIAVFQKLFPNLEPSSDHAQKVEAH
jgi:Ni/Fe-hydrogenase subunit HybB-like protein